MNNLKRIFKIMLLFAIVSLTSCSDESMQQTSVENLSSRGAYDYPPVEWDNVESIKVLCNDYPTVPSLTLPWEPSSSSNGGIPSDWTDDNLRHPDPKKRSFSRENGWEMVFHNLSHPTQSNKYFALYNKFTGVLRVFFYEINLGSGINTTSATAAFRIGGNTSMLNFIGKEPKAMAEKQSGPMVTSSMDIEVNSGVIIQRGYRSNKWYAIEVELAYDADANVNNDMSAWLWADYQSTVKFSGTDQGNITGTVQTVSNNTNSGNSISTTAKSGNSTMITSEKSTKSKLAETLMDDGGYISEFWNDVQKKLDMKGMSAESVIDSIFLSSSSNMAKVMAEMLSYSGRSSSTTTSNSKVDLGIDSELEISGTIVTKVDGWGYINITKLPQFEPYNNLFSGRLGVWNLKEYPKVTVDLMMTSMFYPKTLVPNPERPRAAYPTYTFKLNAAEIVVNPDLLIDYKVEGLTQKLVYLDKARLNFFGTCDGGKAYSIYGGNNYYEPLTYNTLKITGRTFDNVIEWNPNNPADSYSDYWTKYAQPIENREIMCHVFFELVSKTNPNERYAYSKYFPCTAVKGQFSHREETITN